MKLKKKLKKLKKEILEGHDIIQETVEQMNEWDEELYRIDRNYLIANLTYYEKLLDQATKTMNRKQDEYKKLSLQLLKEKRDETH